MRNRYEVKDDHTTVIFLDRRNDVPVETIIDTKNLGKLLLLDCKWTAKWNYHTKSYYVWTRLRDSEGNTKRVYLHRLLTKCPDDLVVDHDDRNSLNNLESNLKVVTNAKNLQNKNVYRNSSSGVTGVSFDKKADKWRVQLKINGKKRSFGYYKTVDEAKEVAEKILANREDGTYVL